MNQNKEIKIIYEDNHLIVVDKPAGIPVEGNDRNKNSLLENIKTMIKERDKKEGNVFLGIVHRLDQSVTGLIIFAKTSKGASRLSEQFRERQIEKVYEAFVEGKMNQKKGEIVLYFAKNETGRKATVSDRFFKGSLEGVMYYRVLETIKYKDKEYSKLEVELETGRFHQIRASLSFIGHPVVGDVKYGSMMNIRNGEEIGLRAVKLKFKRATLNQDVIDEDDEFIKLKVESRKIEDYVV